MKPVLTLALLILLGSGMTPTGPGSETLTGVWDENKLGNHRVVVGVDKGRETVYVRIPWRRRDTDPEKKRIIVIDASSGAEIVNTLPLKINREEGELLFQPRTVPGIYYFYYLPYQQDSGSRNYPKVSYLPPQNRADPKWLNALGEEAKIRNALRKKAISEAQVIGFQAREEWDLFSPLERIATVAETARIVSRFQGHPFLLFAEDRRYPVRMNHDLPERWSKRGPFAPFVTEAAPGEYLTFQVALYAPFGPVEIVNLEVVDLATSLRVDSLSGRSFTCFNLEGVDWRGNPLQKRVKIGSGMVQPFWVGVMIPDNAIIGDYRAVIRLTDEKGRQASQEIAIQIAGEPLPDHGDDDPASLSRLRWLNSRLASQAEPVAPFSPLQREGMRISMLGRELELGDNGLPKQIRSYFKPGVTGIGSASRSLLGDAVRLIVTDPDGVPASENPGRVEFLEEKRGKFNWQSTGRNGPFVVNLQASLEFDGYAEFDVALTAQQTGGVKNIELIVPLRRDVAKFMTGLGFRGGCKPETFSWQWDPKNNQDSLWLGDVNAGLQCAFRDTNYSRPLNTNFYLLKPLQMPPSWYNGGNGRISLENRDGLVRVRAESGPRDIKKGETLHFIFTLLITPFKPLDTQNHFQTRYYHAFKPLDEIRASGANVINVHHANTINPFINYPFLRPAEMKRYVDEAHQKGMKVKIYYTVRELTNRAPEFFPLFSLGNEVFSSGPGGGYSWLQEHLNGDYITGWLVPDLKDAAVVTSGISRWHNHYVEGLAWLVKNMGIDGIYIDDVAFDRTIMKRVRRVLDGKGPGALIDLHSANQFNVRDGFASSANLYMEHFPYIDRLWFGEYFDYDAPPDYWLVEISGIPFGVMGEMLQNGGNPWRGLLYGMTSRLPWSGDPRPIWQALDEFGVATAEMQGYWMADTPVKTNQCDVLATVYKKADRAMIALASWSPQDQLCRLQIDWEKLGFKARGMQLYAPGIKDFQENRVFQMNDSIPVQPGKGWLLMVIPGNSKTPQKPKL